MTMNPATKLRRPIEPPEATILGQFNRSDFARACLRSPRFSRSRHYADFQIEQDALLIGLGAAGILARLHDVPFAAFDIWTRLTGSAFDFAGLDDFAAHWLWRARHPTAAACGRLGDPAGGPIAIADVQWIVFQPDVFLRWREAKTQGENFAPESLDAYATQIVASCLGSAQNAARAEAHSD